MAVCIKKAPQETNVSNFNTIPWRHFDSEYWLYVARLKIDCKTTLSWLINTCMLYWVKAFMHTAVHGIAVLLTFIWDIECEIWATFCSSKFNVMLKADIRFFSVWPSKKQLTLWDHLTTGIMINICLLNLFTMIGNYIISHEWPLLYINTSTKNVTVAAAYHGIVTWNDFPATLKYYATPRNSQGYTIVCTKFKSHFYIFFGLHLCRVKLSYNLQWEDYCHRESCHCAK